MASIAAITGRIPSRLVGTLFRETGFQPVQEAAPVAREGLPYWIFYLLLSLILLLLLVIFLRDKDLRGRISLALAGANRRMQKTRLRLRLKREKRRKANVCREIGRTVWAGRIESESFDPAFKRLGRLETETAEHHSVLREIMKETMTLTDRLEEARQKRKNFNDRPKAGEKPAASAVRAIKEEERVFKRRIRELERKSKTERGHLKRLGREKKDQYERLGAQMDESRIEHPDLLEYYAQIDKINRSILAVMDRIEELD